MLNAIKEWFSPPEQDYSNLEPPAHDKTTFHGYMPFEWQGQTYKLYGGRYRDRRDDMVGIKMAEEIHLPADIRVDTRDFDVPHVCVMMKGVVKAILMAENGDKPLYVGCMGGTGRTGLFMACLAMATGTATGDPVGYVRKHYKAHAVETEEQRRFVEVTFMKELVRFDQYMKVARYEMGLELSLWDKIVRFFKGS